MLYKKPLINLTPLLDLLFIVIFASQLNLQHQMKNQLQTQLQKQAVESRDFNDYKKKIDALIAEIRRQETQISVLDNENKLLKEQLDTVTRNLSELEKRYQKNQQKIARLKAQIKRKQAQIAAQQRRREALEAQLHSIRRQQQVAEAVGNATQHYWNAADDLDAYYVPKISALKKVFEKSADSAADLVARADALDRIVVLIQEWVRREAALPTKDVDPKLVRFFSLGRKAWQRKMKLYRRYSAWLRRAARYIDKKAKLPPPLLTEKDSIDRELEAIAKDSEYYNRSWEGLRRELSTKYQRQFMSKTVPRKYRLDE